MPIKRQRIEQIVREGSMDNEKYLLAVEVMRLWDVIREERREHQRDLNDAARSAADERTWQMTQGDDYGSY